MTTFAIRNLAVLNYAQGFTSWHYNAGIGTLEGTGAPGFFEDAKDMLAPGDMLLISASNGGSILFVDAIAPQVLTRLMCSTAPK